VARVMRRRPYCSDAGAKNMGPSSAVSLQAMSAWGWT
jgi:hypothetical protein